ncbi:hypothetical protein A3863_07895 [Priestia endophytica]|uniref:hypothetical protein n=1 Tax=Priestia endophytica TaxID=135735 RepID=UPI000DCA5742|nr:hypothetical protein [Priestia endophytica]RAS90779.1 hypothetical protein A3863_07880 [Priestia endophytica]RAS90782.1 hypothetical protein A3863_07895 [Priestia endophytica]
MAKETANDRVLEFFQIYGVDVINLIIERHHLSQEKRNWFAARYVEEDPENEKEYTKMMDNLTQKIYKLDEKLYNAGLDEKVRIQILRDIKKVYPDDWMTGFAEE